MLGKEADNPQFVIKSQKEWANFCNLHKPQESGDSTKLYIKPIEI